MMKPKTTLALTLILATARAASAQGPATELTVSICPARVLHAYPLAIGSRFQSLVVPNVAVKNAGAAPADLSDVTFDLLSKGEVVDTRRLAGEDLANRLKAGSAMQNGPLQAFAFQFCDGALLGPNPTLSALPALAPSSAGLLNNEVFGWRGVRDTLRVTVHAARGGRPEQAVLSIPIASDTVKTAMRFPLTGRWFVAVAGTPHGGHRWALPEAFGLDVVAVGADNKTFKGTGERFEDYYAYGAPVLSVADGTVVQVVADQGENPEVLRRANESFEAYQARSGAVQEALLKIGDRAVGGNSVLIDHGQGEFALYAHLKPGSIPVKAGQRVSAGTRIGLLGGSGNSTEPHLHFQVCDGPSALHCASIPLSFTNVELPFADAPRAIQGGDIVIAR